MPTTAFEPFTVVAAPFPYVERPILRRRPCLLIATPAATLPLAWVLMITSADNEHWAGDVDVTDLTSAGLPYPSRIRSAKLATVETSVLKPLGRLASPDADAVRQVLRQALAGVLGRNGARTSRSA